MNGFCWASKKSEFDEAVKDETNVRLNMKAAYGAKIVTKTFVKSKTLLCNYEIIFWYNAYQSYNLTKNWYLNFIGNL